MRNFKFLYYRLFLFFFLSICTGYSSFAGINLIENKGQWKSNVLYRAEIPGGVYFIEKNTLTYYFYDTKVLHDAQHNAKAAEYINAHVVKVHFKGANPEPAISSEEAGSVSYNYFQGNDPAHWASGAKSFNKVFLKELWEGIDLEILCQDDALKYNFHLQPGADPDLIKLEYAGADSISLQEGALNIKTTLNNIIEEKPVALQEQILSKAGIMCRYELEGKTLGFKVKNYNKNFPLIIDPTVIFATYSGSKADNFGFTATYDHQGNTYSGGTVFSAGFPTTAGAFQVKFQGGFTDDEFEFAKDAGILKYSPDGKQLLWATYLGGNNNEQPHSMIINHQGELVILGTTHSANFPVTSNAYDRSYNNNGDIYICKLSADGSTLISSTFVGGSGRDGLNGTTPDAYPTGPLAYNYGDQYRGEVIVDKDDNILIATCTQSSNFPGNKAIQANYRGIQDGCVVKLTPNLNSIIWSTYLGGNDEDAAYGINIDSKDNIFVSGGTKSNNFTTTSSSASPSYNGAIDGFICKISNDGNALLASTYVGTGAYDQNYFIQLDDADQVYVTGQTEGSFPVIGNGYSNLNGKQYIAVFDNDLAKMVRSTVFGSGRSIPDISPSAFLVDLCGRICVSGWGGNTNNYYNPKLRNAHSSVRGLPTTADAYQSTTFDGSDFYLIILSPNFQNLVYGSFFGGNLSAEHVDGGTSRFDRDGKVYQSVCGGCHGNSDFPTTPGAWSRENNGKNPKDPKLGGCNNAVFKMDLNSSNFAPYFKDTTIVVTATDEINYNFCAFDNDISDSLFYSYNSTVFDPKKTATPLAHLTITPNGSRNLNGNLSWRTSCEHISTDTYFVYITLKDNGCPTPRITNGVIKIVVKPQPVPPPPGIFCLRRIDDNTLRLEWNEFEVNNYFENYKLVKRSANDGLEEIVKTFKNKNDNFYIDHLATDHAVENYCYFIYGTNKCAENGDSTRFVCSVAIGDSVPPPMYIHTVTVEDNKNIKVIWNRSHRADYYRYFIYRRENLPGSQYFLYQVIKNINDTTFTDTNVSVQSKSYCYKLNINTQCGYNSPDANYGCSILLEGKSVPFESRLNWNEYKLWKGKVDHYEIMRQDTTPAFFLAGTTNGTLQKFTDDKLNYDWGMYRYKVVAFEGAGGQGATSVSNEIVLIQEPILYVPNAFTPNNNGHNDTWQMVPAFVKDFHMKVYNRWGQFIWETDNKKKYWDGWYNGFSPFDNVFIWQVMYTGWDRSTHYRHGNVTLLK